MPSYLPSLPLASTSYLSSNSSSNNKGDTSPRSTRTTRSQTREILDKDRSSKHSKAAMAAVTNPNRKEVEAGRPIHNPTTPVKMWMLVSSLIVIWDFSFVFLRPFSLKSQGGYLNALWPGYDMYEFIDMNYSAKYWQESRGFPLAQSTMNVIEDVFNFAYLYLCTHNEPKYRAVSPVFGLIGVTMTVSKTILYFLCDYYCGWCESGHNDWNTWITLYLIPNGAWIIVPGILAVYFAREIAALLTAGAGITDSPFAFSEVKEAKKLKET